MREVAILKPLAVVVIQAVCKSRFIVCARLGSNASASIPDKHNHSHSCTQTCVI